jgi:preprotein translocase subunit SecA
MLKTLLKRSSARATSRRRNASTRGGRDQPDPGEQLASLSDDALRAKTEEFRGRIQERIGEPDAGRGSARAERRSEDLSSASGMRSRSPASTSRSSEIEEVLDELLPDAFAVVKECAAGWWASRSWSPATRSPGTWCPTTCS